MPSRVNGDKSDPAAVRKAISWAEKAAGADEDTSSELLRYQDYVRRPEGFVFSVFRSSCVRYAAARRQRRQIFATAGNPEAGLAPPEWLDRQIALREAWRSSRRPASACFARTTWKDAACAKLPDWSPCSIRAWPRPSVAA